MFNDVLSTQDGEHSGPVNSVQWHPEDSVLYSGSDDTHIAEWDLQKGKVSWWVCVQLFVLDVWPKWVSFGFIQRKNCASDLQANMFCVQQMEGRQISRQQLVYKSRWKAAALGRNDHQDVEPGD